MILLDPLGLDRLYAQAKLLRARLGDVVDLPFKRLRYFAGVCANRAQAKLNFIEPGLRRIRITPSLQTFAEAAGRSLPRS